MTQVSDEVMQVFGMLPWHGNVRELQNTFITAMVNDPKATCFGLQHLSVDLLKQIQEPGTPSQHSNGESEHGEDCFVWNKLSTLQEAIHALETWLIGKHLAKYGNQSQAALHIDITRGSLRNKMHQHGIRLTTRVE